MRCTGLNLVLMFIMDQIFERAHEALIKSHQGMFRIVRQVRDLAHCYVRGSIITDCCVL
jgi:hypothetical protein